jgi:TPR repeat protein
MTDIFISYATADRDRVALLAEALEAQGYAVWWDQALAPGAEYASAAEAALSQAKAVLVVWSAASIDHTWTLDAAAAGRDRGVLAAVALDASPIPLGFRQAPTINFAGWTGDVTGLPFQSLRARLASLVTPGTGGTAPMGLSAAPPPPQTNRRTWLIVGGVVLTAGLGAILTYQSGGRLPLPLPRPSNGETTSTSVSAGYGLTTEDLAGFGAQDLVRIARSLEGIAAIEDGAARGDPLGLGLSCLAFSYGEGVPRDPQLARTRCEAASAAGSSLGPLMLARLAQAEEAGLTQSQAADFLAQAGAAGDPRALTELARAALSADPADPAQAANLARRAAEMGHHPAELLYGWMFETGAAGPVSEADAFAWYDAAAQKAYPPGLTAAARLLQEGRGAPADAARARRMYTEAASRGDGEANYRLALMMARGEGGPAEPAQALALMRAAVAAGYADAPAALAALEAGDPTGGTAAPGTTP